jgi:hypothetical protein
MKLGAFKGDLIPVMMNQNSHFWKRKMVELHTRMHALTQSIQFKTGSCTN